MNILRNKYLTRIDDEHGEVFKIKTSTFDEIFCTSDETVDALPVSDTGNVQINGKKVNIADFLQYCDMNGKLFLMSIVKSCKVFYGNKNINSINNAIYNGIILSASGSRVRTLFDNGCILLGGSGIEEMEGYGVRSICPTSSMDPANLHVCHLGTKESLREDVAPIIEKINRFLNENYFIDERGDKWIIQNITINEIELIAILLKQSGLSEMRLTNVLNKIPRLCETHRYPEMQRMRDGLICRIDLSKVYHHQVLDLLKMGRNIISQNLMNWAEKHMPDGVSEIFIDPEEE